MKRYILLLISIISFCSMWAQEKEYMYEIGGGLGSSWTYGDINRSSVIYSPSLASELLFRYNLNLRWSMAMDLSLNRLEGDSKDFDNIFPQGAQWSFNRRYYQFGIRPEFTFWNYGWGSDYREKHRIAPFLTAGMGFGWANGSSSGEDRSTTMLSVPLGLGIKWKMAPRWDLQLTGLWSKIFGDAIDGINDPYKMGTKAPTNTDWVGSIMMSITFCFKERCLECHNQDN